MDDDRVGLSLLDDERVDALRIALRDYTVDSVHALLGPVGQAALGRGDLAGVARAVRADDSPPATLVRLFLLGVEVDERLARRALDPLPLAAAVAAGLITVSGGAVRALLDVRPHAQTAGVLGTPSTGPDWWVVSDFGADVRGGPLAADHVLGIGSASLTLAQSTPRSPVATALDIGTGCGVQALHLSAHVGRVTATDISDRALRLAATTAALSGLDWDLRRGSLLEPVAGETFDLVVANPPFVISAGDGGYDYRDSGLAGDEVCRSLVTGIPVHLRPGGTAQLLANWVVPADGDWRDRLGTWFEKSTVGGSAADGAGCDAWVWQREVAEPAEYVALWLRDAGESPGTASWVARYDAWLDWFAVAGVVAVGMGLITMWRTDSHSPVLVMEDVPQAVEQPAGVHLAAWVGRQRTLAALTDDALLDVAPVAAEGLVLDRSDLLDGGDGWATATSRLRQSYGMCWDLEVDDAVAGVVAACDGRTPLRTPVRLLASMLDEPADRVAAALLPVVRDLAARGFLLLDGPLDPDNSGDSRGVDR